MRHSCTLLQRHVQVKMRNRPQISLITPKITIPKADLPKPVSLIHHTSYVTAWDVAVRFFSGTSWTKTTNRPQISLITPKMAVPKAVTYFNTLSIGPPNAGQPNLPWFLQNDTKRNCTLLQRHIPGKIRNRPQMSLITPKLAVPKAVAYFSTLSIGPPKAGQSNSICFVGYKLLLHCDDLLLVADTSHTITEW